MNKVVVILISLPIFMFSFFNVAQAADAEDCRARITKNYSYETVHYRLNADDYIEPNFGNDHLARSFFYIRHYIDEIGCTKRSIKFQKGPNGRGQSYCQQIHRNHPNSLVCYVYANLGYFFVSFDFNDGVNILFNRWD